MYFMIQELLENNWDNLFRKKSENTAKAATDSYQSFVGSSLELWENN